MKQKLKGFTLVELLAAMAIIAILIGLAGFGISLALRNSRNSQRESTLNDVRLAITDYYTQSASYPSTIVGVASSSTISLRQAGVAVGEAVPAKGATKVAASTSSSGSVYRYSVPAGGDGYYLCVQLEGGTNWYDLSTNSTGTCSTTGVVVLSTP